MASRRRRLEPADAEGSLFTYFATKDELLNQLYLELKTDLREAMLSAVPQAATARDKLRHARQQYVHWGVTSRRSAVLWLKPDRFRPFRLEARARESEQGDLAAVANDMIEVEA